MSISQCDIHRLIDVHNEKQHPSQSYQRTIFPGTRQLRNDLSYLMTLTIIA